MHVDLMWISCGSVVPGGCMAVVLCLSTHGARAIEWILLASVVLSVHCFVAPLLADVCGDVREMRLHCVCTSVWKCDVRGSVLGAQTDQLVCMRRDQQVRERVLPASVQYTSHSAFVVCVEM